MSITRLHKQRCIDAANAKTLGAAIAQVISSYDDKPKNELALFITAKHKQRCLDDVEAEKLNTVIDQMSDDSGGDQPHINMNHVAPGISNQEAVIFAALQQDLKALSDITDVAKKVELKKSALIPKWRPIVDDYIASGAQHKFEPLSRLVIWLLDTGAVDLAILYADKAIAQHQPQMPGFSKSLDEFVAEEIHNWAQDEFKKKASAEPYLSDVIARIESRQWSVTQVIILNKLYKLVGQYADDAGELEKAEAAYLKCVEVNPEKHGVKGLLKAVQTKMGKTLTFA